jgi:hypothetical protein
MNRNEFKTEMVELVTALMLQIGDDYRASEEDTEPSMQLTVGADDESWSYQTGDNSFTGGAYGYSDWAVVSLYRDSNPVDIAQDIVNQFANEVMGEIFETEE